MKAIMQCNTLILFIVHKQEGAKSWVYTMNIKSFGVSIQSKIIEWYFIVVLFIMLYRVVLSFKSVDEIVT